MQPPAIPVFRDGGTNSIAKKYRKLRESKVVDVQEPEPTAEDNQADCAVEQPDQFDSEQVYQGLLDPVETETVQYEEHDEQDSFANQNLEVAFAN